MKVSKSKQIENLIFMISGMLLCVGPFFLFKVCDFSEKIMKCTYSCKVEVIIGIGIILLTIVAFITKEVTWKYYLCNLYMWTVSILIPFIVIGGCESKQMRCNTIAFPCVYLIAFVNIIVNIIGLIKLYVLSKGENNA